MDGLSTEAASALRDYVTAGCPGDVNKYLDERKIAHPDVVHVQADSEPLAPHHVDAPICTPPLVPKNKWIPDKHGGHIFWWCGPE
jgi:hypothetical protein